MARQLHVDVSAIEIRFMIKGRGRAVTPTRVE